MGFKMKGPGLPGFRKQQGSGFYKSKPIPMTDNRSPINQGEGDNQGRWIVDNTVNKGATLDAWNQLSDAEKAKYNGKFSDWKNVHTYQTENTLGQIINVVEQERIMKTYKPGTGFSYISVWNEMPEDKKNKFKNFEDFEIQGKAWNDAQVDTVTEQRKIETVRPVEYTGHQMEVEYLRTNSSYDGFPMIRIKGTGEYKDVSMVMSQAEFNAKYLEDGDLRVMKTPGGYGSNRADTNLFTNNKYFISKDMLENQITPLMELKERNIKNQEKFLNDNQGIMSKDEINWHLANDPNLRTDVTRLSGFNTKAWGTGNHILNNLHPESSWNDPELLAQANNIEELNKLVDEKYGKDVKHRPDNQRISGINRMPFDYNDYNLVDGELVPKDGVLTKEEFRDMTLGQKLNYVNKNDEMNYLSSHHWKMKSGTQYSKNFKEDFAEMINKNTGEIDMSKLDIRNVNGREVMYVNNRPIFDVNEGNFYRNQLRSTGNLEREGNRHMVNEISKLIYGEEMEEDIHTQHPNPYVTPSENRIYVPAGTMEDETTKKTGQYKQKVSSFVSGKDENGRKIVVQNVWDQDQNKYVQHKFPMNIDQQNDYENLTHRQYTKKYSDPSSDEMVFLPPTDDPDVLEQYLQNNPYDTNVNVESYRKSTEK